MNDSPVALVTVRASSGRLPRKCFLPLGGRPVLEHVITRAALGGFRPLVCTSTDETDDDVAQLASKLGVEVFRGNLENKLNRWKECMNEYGLSRAHLVDADDPYFDPIECQTSYQLLVEHAYDMVLTSQKSDSGFASVGTSVTGRFMNEIALRAGRLRSSNFDVIPWDLLLQATDRVITMPNNDLGIGSDVAMRLTLDYPEDYWMLCILAMNLSVDTPRIEVEQFLIAHPSVRSLNLFRSQDFLQNKELFKNAQFN